MRSIRRTRHHRLAGATSASVVGLVIVGALLVGLGFWAGRGWNRSGPAPPESVVAAPPESQDGPARTTSSDAPVTPRAPQPRPPEQPAGPPPFEFDPPQIDFGVVGPDVEMRDSFIVRNVSDQPLTIHKMASDCKCTTVQDLSGTVIAPGQSVAVTAVMEGRSTPGSKKSEIRFVFAGYPAVAQVPIFSRVVRAIEADPQHVVPTDALAGETTLRNLDGQPFRILAVNGETPVFADDFDPGTGEARSEYRLRWDLTAYDPRTCRDAQGNRMPRWWVVETDHPDVPIVDLQVRHAPCTLPEQLNGREWVLNLSRALVNTIPAGESVEFSAYLKWLHQTQPNDTIREVRSESHLFDAELIETEREGDRITCRVRITPKDGHRGLMVGDVRFFGYTPGQSQRLAVIGKVVDAEKQASRR